MNPSQLIMAVRSTEKGETARQTVLQVYPNVNISVWKLDMASFASVKSFADRVKEELDRLDVIVLNAGVNYRTWKVTGDNCEES